jgi:hypothetical protein
MVAAIRSATYIRELDLFRDKVGIHRSTSLYEVATESELRISLNKFLVEHSDHDLPAETR